MKEGKKIGKKKNTKYRQKIMIKRSKGGAERGEKEVERKREQEIEARESIKRGRRG